MRLLVVTAALATPAAWAGPFGAAVESRWSEGAKAESRGDFAAARKAYELALAASARIESPGLDGARRTILRACAAQGSRARIAGARAGEAAAGASGPASLDRAKEAAGKAFREAVSAEEKARPDLADACP